MFPQSFRVALLLSLKKEIDVFLLKDFPKDPATYTKNTTVIVIHYGGSKTLRQGL